MKLTVEEEITQKAYNKHGARWARDHRDPDFWRNEFEKFKAHTTGKKILDVGCGGGTAAVLFAAEGFEYFGIDISETMVKEARKNLGLANVKFAVMSVYDLDFPPKAFDGFWAASSLHHIPKGRMRSVLTKLHAILKEGGTGFVAVKEGHGEELVEWYNSDKRFFTYYLEDEIRQLFEGCRFRVLEQDKGVKGDKVPFLTAVVQKL